MTKKKMIDFILGFEKYPTMNSWNNTYGYSYNVKVYNLPLTKKQKDVIYAMLDTEEFYELYINPILAEWEHSDEVLALDTYKDNKGNRHAVFNAGFNGRMGGHLVLYWWNNHNYTGTGWTFTKEELDELDLSGVKHAYSVLKQFERLYHEILNTVENLADSCKVQDEEYTVKKIRKVIVEK